MTSGRIAATALAGLLCAARADAAELVLDAANGFQIPTVLNHQPVTLRVDLESPGQPVLNPAPASRAGLRTSHYGARAMIGPVWFDGRTDLGWFTVADVRRQHRFAWFRRRIVDDVDGIVSPHLLPYDSVVFRLREERPGEVTTILAMRFDRSAGLYVPLSLGGRGLAVQFSTLQAHSLASASAGAHIASLQGGEWTGGSRDVPVRFRVVRPVRPMRLERPLDLSGFRVADLMVRVADHRGRYRLPADAQQDPDEIVVTGNVERQPPRLFLTIGADRLSACSSLVYARAARTLTLRCLPVGGA